MPQVSATKVAFMDFHDCVADTGKFMPSICKELVEKENPGTKILWRDEQIRTGNKKNFFIEHGFDEARADVALSEFEERLLGKGQELELNPGAKDVIEYLKQSGYKIVFVSNSTSKFLQDASEHFAINRSIDGYIGSDKGTKSSRKAAVVALSELGFIDVDYAKNLSEKKPAELCQSLKKIAGFCGIRFTMIGDSKGDMQFGKDIGAVTVHYNPRRIEVDSTIVDFSVTDKDSESFKSAVQSTTKANTIDHSRL